MTEKTCGHCRNAYPATPEFFHRDRATRDGLHGECKRCRNEHGKSHYPQVKPAIRDRERTRWKERRIAVLTRYSDGAAPFCRCCGEHHLEFLQLDHLNGDGSAHRKEIGLGGDRLIKWAIANGYPPALQVLCCNCNWAKSRYGRCPHQGEAV